MDATTTQVTADLQAIFPGQKDVQNNQIIGRQLGEVLSLLPIIGGIDAIALMGQIRCQRAAQPMVVFYHKNAHKQTSLLLRIPGVQIVASACALTVSSSLPCHYGISR